ncbi:MAG: DUF211 domain-containing protein [Hadesarchaea archaeon]|nr:DUF211 domain-containing protein [Hadesarchaea archaeon]
MVRKKPKLRRLVLDVLKPHSPPLPEFAMKLGSMPKVEGVNVTLVEIDKDTETVKVTIDGELEYEKINSMIEEWGGVIHSVDEVVAGRRPVREAPPPEPRRRIVRREGIE